MDEFPGLLVRDFGFRPQGKNAPMSASKPSSASGGSGMSGSGEGVFADRIPPGYDDIFGGPPKNSGSSEPSLDAMFDGFKDPPTKPSSLPVYDKPVYDDDVFDGVPGVKKPSAAVIDDVFSKVSSPPNRADLPPYDDLLGNLGRTMPETKGVRQEPDLSAFDELIPGFGGSGASQRESPEAQQPTSEDPFLVLGTTSTSTYPSSKPTIDPLEHISNFRSVNSGSAKVDASPPSRGSLDDINNYDDLTSSASGFTSEVNTKRNSKADEESLRRSSMASFENITPKVQPTIYSDSSKTVNRNGTDYRDTSDNSYKRSAAQASKASEHLETVDDAWLTVGEIPLMTQPTSAPPPSRPPPPVAIKQAQFWKTDQLSSVGFNSKRKEDESFSHNNYKEQHMNSSVKRPTSSTIDELDGFFADKSRRYANDHSEIITGEEETETNLAAAAMKEAMDRAEAKFRHAREVRERERDARTSKNREYQQETDEKVIPGTHDFEDKERQDRLVREQEQREREEKEERRRRERQREQELEGERARQAVERATREARDRAAAEARIKAERAAVGRANAEARQRAAERASFQRAANEARERAAAEAREKAAQEARFAGEAQRKAAAEALQKDMAEAQEKAAAETREKGSLERAAADAQRRAEKIAVERATKEARERAAAEAQRRAAAAAREKQQKAENDLEAFFNMDARPNSAPKQRSPVPENVVHPQSHSRGSSDGARRSSSSSSSTIRKAQSTTNLVDDLASVFGGASSSSGSFEDIDGESEERRRARLERHQRTLERTKKALAEKNERDMQAQQEQAERHRIAGTLDIEIKRWSAGKEGNLRALLSTLQYVLWPECGWQPVSLTDLITGASVKKVYRKATLCIHPDKVQQKGANLQQKYISEKVFDLLKEAWNKFNSEELF